MSYNEDEVEQKIELGTMPTYRILNKKTNEYVDAVLLPKTKNGKKYYFIYNTTTPGKKFKYFHDKRLNPNIYSVTQNSGFPIPEKVDEMFALSILNRKTLDTYTTFIDFYENFKSYKEHNRYNKILSHYLENIQRNIQDGMFTSKQKDYMCINMYNQITDFMKCAEGFSEFVNERFDIDSDEDIVLYRSVKDNNEKKYFPSFFSVGDVIQQYYPFSTSMQPEFPIYKWTDKDDYCCVLKIIVKGGLYGQAIPISKFSLDELILGVYEEYSTTYQSEITLVPGTLRIIGDDHIVVPELSRYAEKLKSFYQTHLDADNYQKASRTLEKINCQNTHCRDNETPFTKRLLTVEYTPYTKDEFDRIFSKLYDSVKCADEDNDYEDEDDEYNKYNEYNEYNEYENEENEENDKDAFNDETFGSSSSFGDFDWTKKSIRDIRDRDIRDMREDIKEDGDEYDGNEYEYEDDKDAFNDETFGSSSASSFGDFDWTKKSINDYNQV
jgi:hypothetical protein